MIKAHESAEPFVTLDGTTLAAQNYRGFCSFLLFGPTRSAIDHHRRSTNTGQCAIGTGGRFGGGGNSLLHLAFFGVNIDQKYYFTKIP